MNRQIIKIYTFQINADKKYISIKKMSREGYDNNSFL